MPYIRKGDSTPFLRVQRSRVAVPSLFHRLDGGVTEVPPRKMPDPDDETRVRPISDSK